MIFITTPTTCPESNVAIDSFRVSQALKDLHNMQIGKLAYRIPGETKAGKEKTNMMMMRYSIDT